MDKNFSISVLMDFYGDLLTEKQREALDFYYNQDLSLFEISQHMNISRQGVRDFIKRGEKQLLDMEKSLGLLKRFEDLSEQVKEVCKIAENMKKINTSAVMAVEIEKLRKISERIMSSL
ncbi:MAG: YlxM family DNA-binding protein [Clostridia bacterium]|nr:YlxM family DNA-binding protein [Clostridia bacterium]